MGKAAQLVLSVVLAVLAGGWIAVGRLATPPLLGWAAVAATGFAVAGSALARERRPELGRGAADFTVFAGVMIGIGSAALVSGGAILLGLVALAVVVAYSRLHERRGPLGIVMLAALAGLPFTFGAMAVDRPVAGIVPSILAAWLQVLRVIATDLETESVDRTAGRRTLAVRLGRSRAAVLSTVVALAFIPASLILPARVGFGGAYFLIALFVELAVLVTAARVIVGRMDGANALLKGAMFVGAVALVAGRVA